MSRDGHAPAGSYPVPPPLQGQHPDRFYRPRPVTSDWDVSPNYPASSEAPIHFHQQQARSLVVPPANAADAMHPHFARIPGPGPNIAGGAVSTPQHGPERSAYLHYPVYPHYQDGHARPATAHHQTGQPSFGNIPPRTPSMRLNTAGQVHMNGPSQGYIQDARHFSSTQQSGAGPQRDRHIPQPVHPSASTNAQQEIHYNHYQQYQVQNATDDVVDVEGAQKYRHQHFPFQDHTQPGISTLPPPHPGHMYPHSYSAAAQADDQPKMCGVGIVFHSSDHGCLAVKRLVPGGPAARCGLIKQGDILTYIDDTNVYQQSTSEINHLISGPQGSFVRLRFKRSGSGPVVAVVERGWAPSTAERSKALSNGGGPPSKISPLMWLGDSSNSRDLGWLMEHNVSFILNCAAECANHHTEQLNYLHLRLLDKPEESVRRAFEPAIAFLQKAHEAGHVVYVHCAAGRSRSATLVIAYIMKSRRMSLRDAIYVVRMARPMIKPNIGFFQQLCRYEKDLLGSKSCDMSDFSEFFKS